MEGRKWAEEGDRVTFAPLVPPIIDGGNKANDPKAARAGAEDAPIAARTRSSSALRATSNSGPQDNVGIPYIARVYWRASYAKFSCLYKADNILEDLQFLKGNDALQMGGKELTTEDFHLSLSPEDENDNVYLNYSINFGYSGCEPVHCYLLGKKCIPGQKMTLTKAELRDFESDEETESDNKEHKSA